MAIIWIGELAFFGDLLPGIRRKHKRSVLNLIHNIFVVVERERAAQTTISQWDQSTVINRNKIQYIAESASALQILYNVLYGAHQCSNNHIQTWHKGWLQRTKYRSSDCNLYSWELLAPNKRECLQASVWTTSRIWCVRSRSRRV